MAVPEELTVEQLELQLRRETVIEQLQQLRHKRQKTDDGSIIRLNVGGRVFVTSRDTLTAVSGSMLASMFSGDFSPGAVDEQGCIFIDRNPALFEPLLEYLRTQSMPPPMAGLEAEARYFGMTQLADQLAASPPSQGLHAIMTAIRYGTVLIPCMFCACALLVPVEPMDAPDLAAVLRGFMKVGNAEQLEKVDNALKEATTDGWVLVHATQSRDGGYDVMTLTLRKGNGSTTC